jgi:hypothetical protein
MTSTDLSRLARITADAAEALNALARQQAEAEVHAAHFRRDSAGHRISALMRESPGVWHAKAALAAAVGTTPSVVPRAVSAMRRNGVKVERMTMRGEAFYRVVES